MHFQRVSRSWGVKSNRIDVSLPSRGADVARARVLDRCLWLHMTVCETRWWIVVGVNT